ncbi:MAG: NAD(P)H-dependent oxidoreductase [Desulfamplus sp.]|nr:NAD(P)H-dependent oxidoreductase [Desulfamplus sp.]
MKQIKVIGICGSLRKSSTNMGLLRYAKANAPEGITIEIADLSSMPFYNSDISEKPDAVKTLLNQIKQADALLLACPEYNYSIAPALKNVLDWASREPENSILSGKPASIMGAGGGMGTSRAQYHLRQVGVYLNIHILNSPEVFSNAFTGSFDSDGNLIDSQVQELIKQMLIAFKGWAEKFV